MEVVSAGEEAELAGVEACEAVSSQAPSSPSNSWSSGETAPLPSESAGGEEADSRRPKRCKITREQLSVLISSFDDEPLPNFDQRQALAKLLGMTPRSVQIWFQNRRQRLKPMQPKNTGVGQAIGGGHCLTTPPTRGSGGSALNSNSLSMAGLAAATGMAAGNFESLVLGHAMNQLHHNASLAGHMETFAATKALLGAGYTPGVGPLASLSPRAQHANAALGPATLGVPGPFSLMGMMPHEQAASAAAPAAEAPAPAKDEKADGLLLLLACAGDGEKAAA